MENTKKICRRCTQPKPLTDFHFDIKKNSHASYCKICVSEKAKLYQQHLAESTNLDDILKSTFYKMLQSTRSNAKTKSLPFELNLTSITELYHKQNGKCHYTGTPMSLRTPSHLNRDPLLISLDRLDSEKGYTKDNTVMCCWGANALKGWHSQETFYKTLKLLYENSVAVGKYLCI